MPSPTALQLQGRGKQVRLQAGCDCGGTGAAAYKTLPRLTFTHWPQNCFTVSTSRTCSCATGTGAATCGDANKTCYIDCAASTFHPGWAVLLNAKGEANPTARTRKLPPCEVHFLEHATAPLHAAPFIIRNSQCMLPILQRMLRMQ
jgi:hypothetical protein